MKAYHHHQRGLTLFEVSIAISVSLAVLLSFAPYYIKLMERGLVEQTAQRAKMVYEAAINYRMDNYDYENDSPGVWPESTTVLKDAGYLPEAAMQTSWGNSIALESASNGLDLEMKFTLPEIRFVNAVAAKLPVPKINELEITQLIVRPGQEESLSQLQDLAGIRAWTGDHDAGNNDLTNVKIIQAEVIAANAIVREDEVCTTSDDMQELGAGARAITETDTPGIYAPVFCNGEKWVAEEKLQFSDCKVCIACSDDNDWNLVVCDTANNNGWHRSPHEYCTDKNKGRLAIKFVCGPDDYEDHLPNVDARAGNVLHLIEALDKVGAFNK